MSAWGGYEVLPGLSATGRVAATIWDRIYGHDNLIAGAQQGTVPYYQGGERVRLLGGFDYHVKFPGFNSPVKMSRFDHVASHVTATMSAAVSASDAAMITKAIVSAA